MKSDEEISDPGVPVVKGDLRATQRHVEHNISQKLTVNYVATLAMVVVGCWGVLKVFLHEAKAESDAGVTLVQVRADEKFRAIEQRMDWLDKQLAENKSVTQATNDTVNRLAIRFGVAPTMPQPPEPKDGGR